MYTVEGTGACENAQAYRDHGLGKYGSIQGPSSVTTTDDITYS